MLLTCCFPFPRSSSKTPYPRASRLCLLALLIAIIPSCSTDNLDCPVEARRGKKFTFRLINRSASPQYVGLGCGEDPPIELDTPRGPLRIGPESADYCANTCEPVLRGVKPYPCSDCGGGLGRIVPPGLSTEIEWDRRVWVPANIPPSCSGLAAETPCALGLAVDIKMVVGRLLLCTDASGCTEGQYPTFTADLSLDGVDIEFE